MSKQKGGANVEGRREGGDERTGPHPAVTPPHPIHTQAIVIGTGNHKASLGDSRLSNMHLQMQPKGRK